MNREEFMSILKSHVFKINKNSTFINRFKDGNDNNDDNDEQKLVKIIYQESSRIAFVIMFDSIMRKK